MKAGFILFITVFLFCPGCNGTHKSDHSKGKTHSSFFNFPEHATLQTVGNLVAENLLFRDYMIRASGVGWAATGLTNALEFMPLGHPKRWHLMDGCLKLMEGLKPYQSSKDLWRQLIDYPNAWEETSGSAMITYAMVTGIRFGWLDPLIYSPIVEKAWLALVDKLDENGELEDVCIGTNEELTAQNYLNRKRRTGDHHGQGPLLWTANAIILLDKSINSSTQKK